MLEVPPPPPTGLEFLHITDVQKSKLDDMLWHIVRIPYSSSKACWAMRAVTKRKCTAKIVTNGNNTPAST